MATNLARGERGIAAIELCIILPILLAMIFAVIDFGRFIQARLVIANLSREGGNLASRNIKSGSDLIAMLQSSANPLDMKTSGRICISSIEAGLTKLKPDPFISTENPQVCSGGLAVTSGVSSRAEHLGLTADLYGHLVYSPTNQTADINGVTVAEVFYKYKPITPLPKFMSNMLLTDVDGTVIVSKAIFCTAGGN
jgi:Flp pilus assembly protein TadG